MAWIKSFLEAPRANRDRTNRSRDTEDSPASILAMLAIMEKRGLLDIGRACLMGDFTRRSFRPVSSMLGKD